MPMGLTNTEADLLARSLRRLDMRALGRNTITSLGAARSLSFGLTNGLPALVRRATVDVELYPVRFWLSGDTPTSDQGHAANPGDTIQIENAFEVVNALFIETGAGARLQVTFWGDAS